MPNNIKENTDNLYEQINIILSADNQVDSDITRSIVQNLLELNDIDPQIKLQIFEATHRAVVILSRFANSTENGTQKLGYLLLHKAIYESLPVERRSALDQPILKALRNSWKSDKEASKNDAKSAERIVSHAEIFHQYLFIAEVWLETARASWLKFYSPEDALMYIERSIFALEDLQKASEEYSYSDSTLIRAAALRLRGEIHRHSGQYEQAINDLNQAAQLYGGLHSESNMIDCHCLTASTYYLKGEFGKSKEFIDIALAHPQIMEHSAGYAAALNLLGNIASSQGELDSAKKYHHESLLLYEKINDYAGQASALVNLGTLSEELHDYESAAVHYTNSLTACEKSGNRTELSLVLNNIGKLYLDIQQYEQALSYFERSYQIAKAVGNLPNQELALLNTSQLYSTIAEYDSALQSLEALRKIIGQTGHRILEAAALINVGEIYFQTKNYRASQESFNNSLQILDELGENPDWKSEAIDGLKKLHSVFNKK